MDYRDLLVFKKGFELSMEIFRISKKFPKEERYALTDQIRRSSRSVCVNVAEGYRKRRYPAHFISKLSDADMENSESQVWLHFAISCGYISNEEFTNLNAQIEEIGKLLGFMITNPEKFGAQKS